MGKRPTVFFADAISLCDTGLPEVKASYEKVGKNSNYHYLFFDIHVKFVLLDMASRT